MVDPYERQSCPNVAKSIRIYRPDHDKDSYLILANDYFVNL